MNRLRSELGGGKMEQIDMFDILYDDFKFDTSKEIVVLETFAGIGSQRKALNRIANRKNIKFKYLDPVEFDRFAIQSYNAIHGTDHETKDITQTKGSEYGKIDIFTYSFPCQDISLVGKQEGFSKDSETRSGLLWEVERILKEMKHKPKVLLMENVKNLLSENFRDDFQEWIKELEKLGYVNYFEVLNAKYYGIPQNRERVFMVSILGEYNYNFPRPMPLELKLKDMLEDEVDEKYYLSDKLLKCFTDMTDRNGFVRGERFKPHTLDSEYAYAITTNAGNRPTDNFIILPEKTKKGYVEVHEGDGVYIDRPHQKRGVVQKGMIQTLKTSGDDVGVVTRDLRIRKLTPLECWRLMGFDDEDFEKAKKSGVSDTQLYKQAGNSIVVDVLEALFEQLF